MLPGRLPLGHPVLLLAASPVVVAGATGVALLVGAGPGRALAVGLLGPLLASTAVGVLLLALARRPHRGSCSPVPSEDDEQLEAAQRVRPAGGRDRARRELAAPAAADVQRGVLEQRAPRDPALHQRERVLAQEQVDLMREMTRTPAPPYEVLVGLADQLRWARLQHAEVVLARGGTVDEHLQDELYLRSRLPSSRLERAADEAGNRLAGPP